MSAYGSAGRDIQACLQQLLARRSYANKDLLQMLKRPVAESHFICAGFQNIATAELCARWIAVGAWQPFTRDHHAQSFQELYRCNIR